MQFAFQTLIWGRRIHDLDLVLDTVAACGYQGIELAQGPDDVFIKDPSEPSGARKLSGVDELLGLLRTRGLTLVGLVGGSLERRMNFCGKYRDCFLYVEDFRDAEKEMVSLEMPFRLGLHPHWFMKVQRLSQARMRLAEYRRMFPNRHDLLLLPDTAHLTIADDDPVLAVNEFFDRLAAVHLKDWTPAYGRYSHRYSQGFVSLGQGVVKLREVLQALTEKNYQGWVVVEQDSPDPSAAESAFECAKWLHEHAYMPLPDRAELDEVIARAHIAPPVLRSELELVREAKLLERLIPATVRGPAVFYQAVVESLHDLYGLDVAKLYSYFPANDQLFLLAVAGMEGYRPRPVLDATTCLCRKVVLEQKLEEFDLTMEPSRREFDDLAFLQGLRAKRMIAVPIFNPSNTRHLRYLLNLFPIESSGQSSTPEVAELERFGMLISRLADHVADDICSVAATRASIACSGVKTRDELLVKMRDLLVKILHAEAVSIFLVDEVGERLIVDEENWTTGIKWGPNRSPDEHFYRKGEGLTGEVWATREMRLITVVPRERRGPAISWENRRSHDRDECIFAPIARAGGEVLGVIRVVNKEKAPTPRAATMFTDEDAAQLDSVIQAAIPYLQLLTFQERQSSALVRMTHEFQVPLVAIRGAADLLRHRLERAGIEINSIAKVDYLGDIQDWAQLMGRLANSAKLFAAQPGDVKLRQEKTLLMRDVVAPAVNHVGLLLREKRFRTTEIHYGDFAEIPALWIDRNQFQQVFFNLLSNAIKYADKNTLRVRIDGGAQGRQFIIWFQDWGIGVPQGLKETIFLPGFRSQAAKESDVAGQGIGLHVVRNILRAHGGDIVLTGHSAPTVFEIRIPNTLWFPPPAHKV
jgi:signal transduction histidine kinase/sugar phosphate isomerase/epimerase